MNLLRRNVNQNLHTASARTFTKSGKINKNIHMDTADTPVIENSSENNNNQNIYMGTADTSLVENNNLPYGKHYECQPLCGENYSVQGKRSVDNENLMNPKTLKVLNNVRTIATSTSPDLIYATIKTTSDICKDGLQSDDYKDIMLETIFKFAENTKDENKLEVTINMAQDIRGNLNTTDFKQKISDKLSSVRFVRKNQNHTSDE